MELLLKVGGSQDPRHWRDGQIADIRPDGFHKGALTRIHHCILTLPGDYWQLRGSTNWKWPGQKIYNNIKKYLVAVDSQGKYPWERAIELDEKRIRRRDWFFDYKMLLDLGLITESQFDAIYNKEKDPGLIYIDRAFDQIIRHEDQHKRLSSKYALSKGTVSSGTYSIGSGLNYDTVTAFELDIIAPGDGPLTGDLTGEHNNEETAISSAVTFDVDTATYLLKLTAQSGDEHNGGAYGNGARILFGANDQLKFDETTDGDLGNVEISKLALDATGASNFGVNVADVGGTITVKRLLITVSGVGSYGIVQSMRYVTTANIWNNIIYGTSDTIGIQYYNRFGYCGGNTLNLYNNTIIGNNYGIQNSYATSDETATLNVKNNLVQASNTFDYSSDWWGTHSKNLSEDATSPDAAYRNKDVHTNSVFKNYAADDYRLDSGGDATNLAILDDGEDLSGTFTDDIEGQTRSTWYIGASEIVEESSSSSSQSTSVSSSSSSQSISVSSSSSSESISISSSSSSESISVSSSSSSCSLDPTMAYSRGNYAALPAGDANLETSFTCPEYPKVSTDDDIYVQQTASDEYTLFLWKNKNDDDKSAIIVTWKGKSDRAPSLSTVFLQIYNRNTPVWENLDSNNAAGAGVEFTLSGSKIANLSNYYDAQNWVSCRVYQQAA